MDETVAFLPFLALSSISEDHETLQNASDAVFSRHVTNSGLQADVLAIALQLER